jgi:archaellum component FlaC
MLQPSEVDIQIEVAVLKNRLDHIDESIHGIRDQIEEVEQRVMRLERTTYMLLGGLILLQIWPQIQGMIS